jgi:hypothetical protein
MPGSEACASGHIVGLSTLDQIRLRIKSSLSREHCGQQLTHKTGAVDIIPWNFWRLGNGDTVVCVGDVKRQSGLEAAELRPEPLAAATIAWNPFGEHISPCREMAAGAVGAVHVCRERCAWLDLLHDCLGLIGELTGAIASATSGFHRSSYAENAQKIFTLFPCPIHWFQEAKQAAGQGAAALDWMLWLGLMHIFYQPFFDWNGLRISLEVLSWDFFPNLLKRLVSVFIVLVWEGP